MQALLSELDLDQLTLLRKVFTNAQLEGEDASKFRTLKSSNATCQTRILAVEPMLNVVTLAGFQKTPSTSGDYVLTSSNRLPAVLAAVEVAISTLSTKADVEYEQRKAEHQRKQASAAGKLAEEKLKQQTELGKIKQLQADVHARPVTASIADSTMGHAAAAEGIFAGAGGKSSSAKTFKDLGVALD